MNKYQIEKVKKVILIILILSFPFFLFSQQSKSINSIKELSDSIEKIIQKEHITGLMLGITTKDSVLFSGGFGYADRSTKLKVDDNTLFRMGSITKMFVSLGIMKLVSEGRLNLTDELAKIAPEVSFKNDWETTHPVQIVHLLEHTSGFDDIKLNRMYALTTKENTGLEMMLVHKPSMICRWQPGERYAYSNPNYAILGYIIQKISGKPYEHYLTESILNPLGMTQSNFNLRRKLPEQDVKEYIFKHGQTIPVPSVTLLSGPQGALWSSANDMVKFLQLFLRDGDTLFNKKLIDEIETTHSPLSSNIRLKSTYALGNSTANIKGKYLWRGHDGLTGTCYSDCYYNHELNLGFVMSSNSNNDNYAIWKLIIAYLERDKPIIPLIVQTLDKKSIEPFLGFYQFESPRNEISGFKDKLLNLTKIYFDNNKLYARPLMGEPTELIQTAPMTFALMGRNTPQMVFATNSAGKNCLIDNGRYYEQTSAFGALTKRLILIISLLFILSSYILGIISLIGAILRKLKWGKIVLRILPMIGVSLLIWAVFYLLEVQEYTYKMSELGTINSITLVIFCGTLAFGLISIAHLFYSIKAFLKTKNWLSWYLLLIGFSMCLIAFILWGNGWIGLRTWAL
jgi:CubicO group peptidase (beta-lactamase class C family)